MMVLLKVLMAGQHAGVSNFTFVYFQDPFQHQSVLRKCRKRGKKRGTKGLSASSCAIQIGLHCESKTIQYDLIQQCYLMTPLKRSLLHLFSNTRQVIVTLLQCNDSSCRFTCIWLQLGRSSFFCSAYLETVIVESFYLLFLFACFVVWLPCQ